MSEARIHPRAFVVDRLINTMTNAMEAVAQEVGAIYPNEAATAVFAVAARSTKFMCRFGNDAEDRMKNQRAMMDAIDALRFSCVDVDTTGVH